MCNVTPLPLFTRLLFAASVQAKKWSRAAYFDSSLNSLLAVLRFLGFLKVLSSTHEDSNQLARNIGCVTFDQSYASENLRL